MSEREEDVAAERVLLADMLAAHDDRVDEAFRIVTPQCFLGQQERTVFEAMMELRQNGSIVDVAALANARRSIRGWATFVAGLSIESDLRGTGIKQRAEVVAERAEAHRLRESIEKAGKRLGEGASSEAVARTLHVATDPALSALTSHTESLTEKWPYPPGDPAFDGLAGEFVRLVEPHSEADPTALLSQFLVIVGNVVGRTAFYQIEADRHYANEYVNLVGQSSRGRKGTALSHAMAPLEQVDPEWMEACRHSGLSSGEGLIWAVRNSIEKRVRQPGGSYELEVVDDGVVDKRALVVESEFANVLRVVRREGNTLSGITRNAWDRGELSSMTKNSPAKATGAHVSIVGHVTRDELLRYLDRTEVANGFGNRFLWVCVRRSRLLPEGGCVPQGDLQLFAKRLRERVEPAKRTARVKMDVDSRDLWYLAYPLLGVETPGMLGAITARAEAHTIRLALIYALLDGEQTIRARHLRSALAFWDYCARSAKFIFGRALGDPVADEILGALRREPPGLDRQAIRDLFSGHRNDKIPGALSELSRLGLAQMVKVPTGGRPRELWTATKATEATNGSLSGDLSSLWSLPSRPATTETVGTAADVGADSAARREEADSGKLQPGGSVEDRPETEDREVLDL